MVIFCCELWTILSFECTWNLNSFILNWITRMRVYPSIERHLIGFGGEMSLGIHAAHFTAPSQLHSVGTSQIPSLKQNQEFQHSRTAKIDFIFSFFQTQGHCKPLRINNNKRASVIELAQSIDKVKFKSISSSCYFFNCKSANDSKYHMISCLFIWK